MVVSRPEQQTLVQFVVGFAYAAISRSFRRGFEVSALSLVVAFAGYIAMGMAESWRWYHRRPFAVTPTSQAPTNA